MRVCVYGSNSTQAFVQKSNKTFNIALINWRKAGLGGNKSVSTQCLCVCVCLFVFSEVVPTTRSYVGRTFTRPASHVLVV